MSSPPTTRPPHGAEHGQWQNLASLSDPRVDQALSISLRHLSDLSARTQGTPATSLVTPKDLGDLSAPPQDIPIKTLVEQYGDSIEQHVTFLIDDIHGVYDSGERVVLSFEASQTPEAFAEDLEGIGIDERLYDYLDAFLASENPADLPFTGRQVVKAELGIEVPEDLKQAKLVSLASLRKVKFLGMDCDLVAYDDEVWAFKYSADSEDLGQILEQIRRLERLGASGATHFVPLHAIILDSYNHLRGFIMPYQAGGSLVQFHKAALQAAQGAEPPAGSIIQKSGDRPQSIQSPLEALVWHDCTRLFWTTQLAKAVAEMHQLDMVHGDIKPENTVIDKNGRLLIIDVYCDGFTKDFAAPEVLAHPGEPEFMSKQHDVYCVGISITAILEERSNLSPPTFPLTWNPDGRTPLSLRKLIMGCLCSNPEDRPSIGHIVSALECACRLWMSI